MGFSKKKDAQRQREWRAKRRAEKAKAQGTAVLPKKIARRLQVLGIKISRYLVPSPVPLQDYKALLLDLDAKRQRIEWQKDGSRRLNEEIRQLHALIQVQAGFLLDDDKDAIRKLAKASLEEPEPIPPRPAMETTFGRFTSLKRNRRVQEAKDG